MKFSCRHRLSRLLHEAHEHPELLGLKIDSRPVHLYVTVDEMHADGTMDETETLTPLMAGR
jgi:hypothetical protein